MRTWLLLALLTSTTLFADSANRLSWNSSAKLSTLASEGGHLQLLGRLRLDLRLSRGSWLDAAVAYEHRAHWWSDAASQFGALPRAGNAAFRLHQLDWAISDDDDAHYRHEIDRAYLAFHPAWGEVSIGRQAIGLGRGVIFSAVDFFAPFSPVEADREWRRGVDALRLEYRLSSTASAEILGVLGESRADSAGLLRLRGYLGLLDAEIMAGERAHDSVVAAVISATVGDAEIHAEAARLDGIINAIVGSSYTFGLGDGLTVFGEYRYSGFGLSDIRDLEQRLLSADFRQRLLRGDLQTLGRHGLAFQASYPLSDLWTGSVGVLTSPHDGSGLLMPSLRWDVSSHSSAIATAYIPWGKPARSEYGSSPAGVFLQLSSYF